MVYCNEITCSSGLLKCEGSDGRRALGRLQKTAGIHVGLERWIRAYTSASFPSTERKARLSALSQCRKKDCVKAKKEKYILFYLAKRQLTETH